MTEPTDGELLTPGETMRLLGIATYYKFHVYCQCGVLERVRIDPLNRTRGTRVTAKSVARLMNEAAARRGKHLAKKES
jgi:hypothetical protein